MISYLRKLGFVAYDKNGNIWTSGCSACVRYFVKDKVKIIKKTQIMIKYDNQGIEIGRKKFVRKATIINNFVNS